MVRVLTRTHTRLHLRTGTMTHWHQGYLGAPGTNDWIRLVLPQRLPLVSLENQVISTLPLAKSLSDQCVVMYIVVKLAVVHACFLHQPSRTLTMVSGVYNCTTVRHIAH